jgi:ABC-type lipoprotein release transport system permease subunit
VFFFLAISSITRNFKDRVVIVLLISVITFIFFIGNSIIANANRNIHKTFVENITGDVVLQKSSGVTMNLFGANVPVIDDFFSIPVIPAYDLAMELISSDSSIEGITSQVSGKAVIDLLGIREPVLLAGIDTQSYFPLFPGIIIEKGSFLTSGEYGVMITAERAKRIEERTGRYPVIGMTVILTSGSQTGFKFREVPLKGIFKYQNPGQFMNEIVITDPQTVRVLNSIQVAGYTEPQDSSQLLLSGNLDDLFGESLFFAEDEKPEENEFSVDLLQNYLSESNTGIDTLETGGDWNFIIMRLKKGISASSFIKNLNEKLVSYGLTAVDWRIASGTSSILTLLVMALFNAGIFLVGTGGVIAIINILLISVFRRVREIGTLRAIGASDTYIRSLIFTENLIVAVVSALIGVFAGFIFIKWINNLKLKLSNELIVSILNGNILRIEYMPDIAVYSFIAAIILGLAVTIYPLETAVRIEPIQAVQKG